MRLKSAIITLLIVLTGASTAYATYDITGDIYGEVFRLMDLNGNGINSYFQPYNYAVTIDDVAASEDCDGGNTTCPLKGLSWSDIVGWTFWDGAEIQDELGGSGNFPDEYIAKAAFNGNIGGYIWGEKYGWISLSVCNGLDNTACTSRPYCEWTSNNFCEISKDTRLPMVTDQDEGDWGIYIDFCMDHTTQATCESPESNAHCNWDAGDNVCTYDAVHSPDGNPLGGYAWSQYLGWIKFGPTGTDTEFSGAFTQWIPDLTPPDPIVLAYIPGMHAWIPNQSSIGAIFWNGFADENESFVNLRTSWIKATRVDSGSDFTGCPNPPAPGAYPIGAGTIGNVIISYGLDKEVNLAIRYIGDFPVTPPNGFCQYTLSGVLYNASQIGYYFGPEGLAQAVADGVNISNPTSAEPHTYTTDPITISVRAGSIRTNSITNLYPSANNLVADGNNSVQIRFNPVDIAGNTIVSVKGDLDGNITANSDDWVRNVDFLYDLDSSQYTFDSINWLREIAISPFYPLPVIIEGLAYTHSDLLKYPQNGLGDLNLTTGGYLMELTGYAPTTTIGNHLELSRIDFNTNDKLLPAISARQGSWPASTLPIALTSSNTPALNFNYYFEPALEVTAGDLNVDFLSINQPAEANYEFINNSTDSLAEYSLDNILDFYDAGAGAELLEVQNINLVGSFDPTGRTDPNGPDSRYGLVYSSSNTDNAGANQFHSNETHYHQPAIGPGFTFENLTDDDGIYEISGNAFVPPGDPCLEDSSCPSITIDRSDLFTSPLTPSTPDSFAFNFTPTRFLGASAGQILFDIEQYLSYHSPAFEPIFSQHAIYPAQTRIEKVPVRAIGLETSGTVSGSQVYDSIAGRDLATITTTSSADLRREIRRNVAVLTRNMTPCPANTLDSLPLTGDCVTVDTQNKTIVAFYSDEPGDVLTLGNGTDDIEIPNGYRYTLILDAINLNIESNLVYPADPNTSFGMIVIQNSDGFGGSVFLDPAPTNIVGLLYAEGPLLSTPDAGTSFYYSTGGPDASALGNQLLWQGSIASKNTIGGASTLVTPENADCSRWDSQAACSQAYDLDFTRRFTTIEDQDTGDTYAPASVLFSGGGSCVIGPINCTAGPILATTVELMAGTPPNLTVIDPDSQSLDAFFIERDNRPVPPGFSSKGGLTSTQEIR
ncbi:hypothetical protein JXD20_01015 [Candidatus Peregrinibacteria bacterium]|nr:hypothetical protein [Candidatus Peregrinibacteria bacterium]